MKIYDGIGYMMNEKWKGLGVTDPGLPGRDKRLTFSKTPVPYDTCLVIETSPTKTLREVEGLWPRVDRPSLSPLPISYPLLGHQTLD